MVLKALAQRIVLASSRSAKVADPPLLTDGTDPTFDNWKLQLQDKLKVNADHFPNAQAKMAYVFGRTGGNAQTHLSIGPLSRTARPVAQAKSRITT